MKSLPIEKYSSTRVNMNMWIYLLHNKVNNKLRRHHLGDDHLFRDRRERKKDVINKILEKISNSGYDSLSEKEKKILFKESQK